MAQILFNWLNETVIQSNCWNYFGWYLFNFIMKFNGQFYFHYIKKLTAVIECYYLKDYSWDIIEPGWKSLIKLSIFKEYLLAVLSNPLKNLIISSFMSGISNHYWT